MPQRVVVDTPASGQSRVTFTSAEVGNGNPNDSGTLTNQDGGLAVRVQAEAADGTLTGPITRYTDEDIVFVAGETQNGTFDVRDLVSGTQRGDQFVTVQLGTQNDDVLTAYDDTRATYINAGQGNDTVTGGQANDFLVGGAGNDILTGGLGNDSLLGGAGDDTARLNVSTDGSDTIDLGDGSDRVEVSRATAGQVRLSFTSAEVGNGSANDGGTLTNQDGGLAVRIQDEDGADGLTGPISRADDEGVTFVAADGVTFDVRDLVSGVQRGDQFRTATLGTQNDDVLTVADVALAAYINAGQGNDTVTGGQANDFLVGGAGNDILTGGLGSDSLLGGAGDDTARLNVSTDGSDTIDLGDGSDRIEVSRATAGQVRLSFTSAEVGNGSANDGGTLTNQDGGLAVRIQEEDGADGLTGPISRADDEGVTFVAGDGVTFDVRDLVSGVQRGDQFRTATLGTVTSDTIRGTDQADYINAGQGNDLVDGGLGNDFLVGGAGNDTLNGGAGIDSLLGGAGNDSYIVDNAGDQVIEAAGGGTDTVFALTSYTLAAGQEIEGLQLLSSTTGDFNLTGNEFNNTLVGNNAANVLNGGAGVDLLVGRGGNDSYIVDNAGDQVIEAAGGGTDTVFSFTSYTLAAGQEIEGLQLLSSTTGNFNLTGNEFNNTLVGNNGANVLNGGAGADLLIGRGGNDSYIVDNAGDQVIEAAGGGTDTVFALTSYTLAAGQEIEGLQLLSSTTGNFNLTGNEFNNTLVGNNGANVLDGGAGADVLIGRGGSDTFAFSTALGNGNVDTIVDFTSADTIRLSASIFTALSAGELDDAAFKDIGAGGTVDADDRIVYNSTTGALSYDADGSGSGAAVQFATLQNKATLSADDFLVA